MTTTDTTSLATVIDTYFAAWNEADATKRLDLVGAAFTDECHYVDPTTKMVVGVVGADQQVARINGEWLITNHVGASPILEP